MSNEHAALSPENIKAIKKAILEGRILVAPHGKVFREARYPRIMVKDLERPNQKPLRVGETAHDALTCVEGAFNHKHLYLTYKNLQNGGESIKGEYEFFGNESALDLTERPIVKFDTVFVLEDEKPPNACCLSCRRSMSADSQNGTHVLVCFSCEDHEDEETIVDEDGYCPNYDG